MQKKAFLFVFLTVGVMGRSRKRQADSRLRRAGTDPAATVQIQQVIQRLKWFAGEGVETGEPRRAGDN
jgi:hypothetical protein